MYVKLLDTSSQVNSYITNDSLLQTAMPIIRHHNLARPKNCIYVHFVSQKKNKELLLKEVTGIKLDLTSFTFSLIFKVHSIIRFCALTLFL